MQLGVNAALENEICRREKVEEDLPKFFETFYRGNNSGDCQFDPHPARCARLPPPNSGEGANRSLLAPLLEFGEGSGSEITICVR